MSDDRRQSGRKGPRAEWIGLGDQEGADGCCDDPFRVSPTNTMTAGPLPRVRMTLEVPGLPLPTSWMSTPCIRATRTAKSTLPMR